MLHLTNWIPLHMKKALCTTMAFTVTMQLLIPATWAVGTDINAPHEPLTQSTNTVTEYVNQEDGQPKTIYWTQGVIPPKMGGTNSDFIRTESTFGESTFVEYIAPFVAGNGWFDTNKSKSKTKS